MELTLTSAEREVLLEILKQHHRELFREICGRIIANSNLF